MRRATAGALAVFAATAFAGVLLATASAASDVAERRRVAENVARRAAAALESELGRSVSATSALAAAVRPGGDVERFDDLSAEMLRVYGGIASLQLAPAGVVSRIHPLAGNEAALGHDLFADPSRRADAEATVATRRLTLAGPFALKQGGIGVVARYPVFRPGAGARDAFWGFTIAVLNLEDVLAAARVRDLEREGYAFLLERADGGRAVRIVSSGTLPPDPVRVAIAVPNGEWSLALAPAAGWPTGGRLAFGCALALVVAAALGALAYVVGREPERLRALVALRTAELNEAYDRLARDTAEHRRTEERLRHAQKMEAIGQLAGGVAHDFNNVLTGILGCATSIAEEAPPGSSTEEAARIIEQAARRAAELTNQLLGFARRGKLLTAPVDVHAAVAEAARLLARTLGPGIVVVQRLEAAAATVLGDAGQLQQAILNLAVNARDALPRGGTLTLATENVERTAADLAAHPGARPGRFVALSVEDTGEGVAPELRERIFEPFFTTKEPGRGTGMGLATVYGIATNHGGLVELESEPGRGARFTLLLPVHGGTAARERPPAPVRLDRPARVLVVDDDVAVRAGAERALSALRCSAQLCDGGPSAVARLRADPAAVDVAIVDLAMPGMDGLATFHALRAVAPSLPVVVSSGYGGDGRAQEVLDAGACAFLPKPWALDELAAAISGALASRREPVPARR